MVVRVFLCYAREDETLLNKLKSHLKPLQLQGLIEVWHDGDIRAGAVWEQEVLTQLDSAQIILLVLSADFMNSEFCYGHELAHALERHNRGEIQLIPIVLRPVWWQNGLLGKLQALPKNGIPVTSSSWPTLDEAFLTVVEGIDKVVREKFLGGEQSTEVTDQQSSQIPTHVHSEALEYILWSIHTCP